MNRSILFVSLVLALLTTAYAQKPEIKRIDPQFWWHNLETRELQLLVYGVNTSAYQVNAKTNGVIIEEVKRLENVNYLLLYLDLGDYHGNQILLDFSYEGKVKTITYKLETLTKETHSLDASDLVYLVFPDRFANGDPKNDAIKVCANPIALEIV